MKTLLLLAGLCALTLAIPTPTKIKYAPKKYKITDKVVLEKYMFILDMLKDIHKPEPSHDIVGYANRYEGEDHYDEHQEWVKYWKLFLNLNKYDHIPDDEVFSYTFPEHLQQAIMLFKAYYYVENWTDFVTITSWTRMHIHEGLFSYSFFLAVIHRPDIPPLPLPSLNEIVPHYFYTDQVYYKAQSYKTEYPIIANYSSYHYYLDHEQYLTSFTEDVGLSNFYFLYHAYYPFWMDGKEFGLEKDRRGELFYHVHQYLWARYYSERLSYGYEPLPALKHEVKFGSFHPSLVYRNGVPFPTREEHAQPIWDYHYNFYNFSDVYCEDGARRIRDAIELGYAYDHHGEKINLYDEHGFETFANMVEGNPNSPNVDYYGVFQVYIRYLLGYGKQPRHIIPSVVERYQTALRDTAYWQYIKWIIDFFQEYEVHDPHKYYTKTDMFFPGVKVESMVVDRLTTYYEWTDADLIYALGWNYTNPSEPHHVPIRQKRLNHKPFTYTINVNTDHAVKSVVRVFIGPKYDYLGKKIDININRLNFYPIDQFTYTLSAGKNTIVRNSKDTLTVNDKTSFYQLYQRALGAYKGREEEFVVDGSETHWGMPNRLLLPTGKISGMPFQFYVILTPYHEDPVHKVPEEIYYPKVGSGLWWGYDKLPFGFPFDKPIDPSMFYVPNAYFYDVKIYHKKYEELNVAVHHD